jgi:osmotically-inducible protein OsmY
VLTVFLRSDEDIAYEVEHEVILRSMATDPAQVHVHVTDGVVTLRGQLERKSSVEIAESLTHAVAGVVDVVNKLTYAHDDEHLRLLDPVDGTRSRDLW